MTRETKIGLLVGLAFIIVIGILLSDHMTSTTQPPTAALADAAANVRESVTPPAPTNPGPAPVGNVPPITPANPVLTQSELHRPVAPPPAPVSQVVIGGPTGQPAGSSPIAIRQTGSPLLPQLPQQFAQPTGQVVIGGETTPAQPEDATSALEQWAQAPTNNTTTTQTPPAKPTLASAATGPKQEYVAVAGDSLSRIAAKTLGADNKANREAIVKANPTLQKNPNLVVEGRKYTIPAAATVAAAQPAAPTPAAIAGAMHASAQIPDTVPVAPRTPAKAIPVTELVDVLPASTPAAGGGIWYVVKDNDNLWKIAAEQLGSGNAWLQIKEMNKDVLKGGDTVQPNMRLRLPGKPLASAAG
jgi:nucleoid-associated protein YgaU